MRSVPDELGLPLIVKPPHEGSSIGVTKVMGYSQMQDAVAAGRAATTPIVLCEEFIDGDELTCPVLGEGDDARALPVIRIVAPEGAYDYQNKYFTDDTQLPRARAACPRRRSARSSAIVVAGLPHAGLPRLGPRRPDDARQPTASPSCWR